MTTAVDRTPPHRAVTCLNSSPTLFTPRQPRGAPGCHLPMPGTYSALALLFLETSSPGPLQFVLSAPSSLVFQQKPLNISLSVRKLHMAPLTRFLSPFLLQFSPWCVSLSNPAQVYFLAYYLTLPLDHIPGRKWLLPLLFPTYIPSTQDSFPEGSAQWPKNFWRLCPVFISTDLFVMLRVCVVSDFCLWVILSRDFSSWWKLCDNVFLRGLGICQVHQVGLPDKIKDTPLSLNFR